MYKFTKSVFVNRSPQDVFDFLSNPANLSTWQPTIESAKWTATGMPGIKSTYSVLVKMPGGKKEGLFEITQWDPPNRYSYKSVKLAFPGTIESCIALAPKKNGTQVTFEAQIAVTGILKIAEGILGKQAEKQDGGNIETAKQLLEASSWICTETSIPPVREWARDQWEALTRRFTGVPAFLINDQPLAGPPSFQMLQNLIDPILARGS
jgi:carbon monoxide dehydrogenase subunit G